MNDLEFLRIKRLADEIRREAVYYARIASKRTSLENKMIDALLAELEDRMKDSKP